MTLRTGWQAHVERIAGAVAPLRVSRRGWWLVSCGLTLSACGASLRAGRPARNGSDALVISEARAAACPRSPGGEGATYREELPGAITDPARAQALAVLPPAARRTAKAAGLEPLIAEVLVAWERGGHRPTLESVALRQRLDAALASLQPQLLAMEFEAECNVALLGDALAVRADDRDRWTTRYTVASLVAGAASVLVAGAWDLTGTESNGPLIAGLVGAGATTVLGFKALAPPGRRILFAHRHNLLAPVARGEDGDRLYPTFVFRLLTLPMPSGAATPRDRLVAEWQRLVDEAVPGQHREAVTALLRGSGGTYDDETLALRRRLYEELESTLDSFARDVDLLHVTLAQVLGRPGAGPDASGPR